MADRKIWEVLIIDDDPGILNILAISLEDRGYNVLKAADGNSGVALCLSESPQIVITDIQMPGMSGMEVLQEIKQKQPDTEVIVVSAFGEFDAAIRALRLGASDFVMKPIGEEALTVALERAKERHNTRRDLRDYTSLLEEKWMQTAEQLAKTFQLQRLLIESSIDGIVAAHKDGRIAVFNRAMEQMLGYSREKAIETMSIRDLFPWGESEKFEAKLFSEGFGGKNHLFLYETNLIGKGADPIPCQVSASVLSQDSQEVGLVCFFRDLREMRRLAQEFEDQARLLQQDKMISLGKLAASVVHEINNPIAGVLNYARLMLKVIERGEISQERTRRFHEYLTLMESELGRCSRIISNLLAFSRKSELEFKPVDLGELVTRCITLSEHRLSMQKIRIESFVEPGLPPVTGDFNQLQQCLINLIFNALDAMPDGGLLKLACRSAEPGQTAELLVEDTGIGISAEDLPYVFDPFYTTKKEGKGTGLGLSTVYGIVDRHKGRIVLKSDPGKGSIFSLLLPVDKTGGLPRGQKTDFQ